MAVKRWVKAINEWHLWPGLAVAATAIMAGGFFLILGLFR
jgi:hypothetical protein